MKPKILVLLRHSLCPESVRILTEVGDLSIAPRFIENEELAELAKDCIGIVLGGNKFGRDIIERSKKLRVISRHGVGVDNVDLDAATERGIVVTYTPGANSISVAEHTFALILALIRKINLADRSIRDGEWKGLEFEGIELAGKTLGIIGLGAIGSNVAKRAIAFEMNVLAYDPYVDRKRASELGVRLVDLDLLLKSSDVVSIHASLTDRTRNMLSWREIGLLKPTAILVNTARGQLVDEEALIHALKERKILGAALDVFNCEPLPPNHPLLKEQNVILTPHIAAFTKEALSRGDMILARDLVAVIKGERPTYVANPGVFLGRG
ncbi:MAG: hydroxyacid dehydrogenase [Thermoproteota archaeon]